MLHKINEDLLALEQLFCNVEATYPQIARTANQARYDYDIAYADAVDTIEHRALEVGQKKPTVAAVESEAVLMVKVEMEKARTAETELKIAGVLIKSLESRLSSTQSRTKLELIELGLVK